MQNPNAKQLIFVTIVIFAALALTFSLILRNSFDFRGLSLKEMPGRRPGYNTAGKALPNDAAFILPSPIELAHTPTASRYDHPRGSEHGVLGAVVGGAVYSIGAGRVIYSSAAGSTIIVAHRQPDGSLFQSVYSNLQRRDVDVGTDVLRGEKIGTQGDPVKFRHEARNTISANPGEGYRGDLLAPARGAADDLLNPTPLEALPALEIPTH